MEYSSLSMAGSAIVLQYQYKTFEKIYKYVYWQLTHSSTASFAQEYLVFFPRKTYVWIENQIIFNTCARLRKLH